MTSETEKDNIENKTNNQCGCEWRSELVVILEECKECDKKCFWKGAFSSGLKQFEKLNLFAENLPPANVLGAGNIFALSHSLQKFAN